MLSALLLSAACGGHYAVTEQPKLLASPPELELKKLPPEHEVTARVELKTSKGKIVLGLYGKDAPQTVENFLKYVDRGFYSGKICHRVIPGFMVQCGGFDTEFNRAPTDPPIKLEIIPGLKHEPGILSMARTSNPHSASSQFFICVGNSPQLNGIYAAFGKIEEGYEVVEGISNVETRTADAPQGPMVDVPSTPVVIESAKRR